MVTLKLKRSPRLPPWLVLVLMLSGGCGYMTEYRPLAPSGGYYEIPTSDGRLTVVMASNGSRMGPVLDLWLLHRCAQLTLNEGHSHFRILQQGEKPPDSNDYGSYRTATIEMLDAPGKGEVYEAQATADRTEEHLIGPARFR